MMKRDRNIQDIKIFSSVDNGKAPVDKDFLAQLRDRSLDEFEAHASEDLSGATTTIRWSNIMSNRIVKFAVTVAAIIAISIFIFTPATSSYAMEQTIKAMSSVKTSRMKVIDKAKTLVMSMRVNQQTGMADHLRLDTPETGDVIITVPGQTYVYCKEKNEVKILGQELLQNDLNYKDVFNSIIKSMDAVGGRVEIAEKYSEIAAREMIYVTMIRADESMAGELVIDPESSLPLFIGRYSEQGDVTYMGPIEYDFELSEDAFNFVIPEGATIIDTRSSVSQTQPELD